MGKATVFFLSKPSVAAVFSAAGQKESEGPIGEHIDMRIGDDYFGEKTFEKAECKMLSTVIQSVMDRNGYRKSDIDSIISGDLLNQIVSANFAARDFNIPYIGIYNACSTYTEGLALAAALTDGGYMKNVIVATGSHFSTAERQYRYPLEFGSVRPPQSQWTVTGAGSAIVSRRGDGPKIVAATFGKVVDYGISDANNMGAAMAPAAMDTLINHFSEIGKSPDYYDLILTGDLGALGSRILKHISKQNGCDITKNHVDCGEIIYRIDEKDYQGGSGAGCSAVVFNSYIYKKIKKREFNKVLFLATGALLSTTSIQQGETIPCISHAVALEND